MQRSQYREAGSHFASALALARKAPESRERRCEEAQLYLDQLITVQVLKGPGSVEVGQMADDALRLTTPLGDHSLFFRAGWVDWMHKSVSGTCLPLRSAPTA